MIIFRRLVDNQLDFEIHSLDWDENTNMENIDNDAPEHDDSVGLNESHNLFTLDRLQFKLIFLC